MLLYTSTLEIALHIFAIFLIYATQFWNRVNLAAQFRICVNLDVQFRNWFAISNLHSTVSRFGTYMLCPDWNIYVIVPGLQTCALIKAGCQL